MPVTSVATHSGLGCPARALSHAPAFRGVAMGLAMSSAEMPVHGTAWVPAHYNFVHNGVHVVSLTRLDGLTLLTGTWCHVCARAHFKGAA